MSDGKKTVVSLAGTGADLNVTLGFIPHYVKILNATTRTELNFDQADAVNTKGIAVGADGVKTSSANGVVVTDADSDFKGFVLAAGANVNVVANPLVIEAGLYDYITY